MTIGPRRAGFYVSVLAIGFVVGGFLSALMQRFLPQGPAKELFTFTVSPSIGPFHINLLVVNMMLGPIQIHVSLLALVGVILAYLVARSLF